MRAQAVWFHRDERRRPPPAGRRVAAGRRTADARRLPTPPTTRGSTARRTASSCSCSGAVRTGCRAGPATRLGRYRQHDVVTGERFDGDFDQRHAVSLYGVYRLNDRTSVAMKLRASSNFPVRGYFQELPASPRAPRARRPAGTVRAVRDAQRRAACPSISASTCAPTARGPLQRSRLTLYVELMNVFGKTNWRTGNGGIRPDGEIVGLLDPLVPFVPSAGLAVGVLGIRRLRIRRI